MKAAAKAATGSLRASFQFHLWKTRSTASTRATRRPIAEARYPVLVKRRIAPPLALNRLLLRRYRR